MEDGFLDNTAMINFINRITDGDNITLEDAFEHVSAMTDCDVTPEQVEAIYVLGIK